MKTHHQVCFGDATDMRDVAAGDVHLVVTSPPYPMIEMWDDVFAKQDRAVRESLEAKDGWAAFEAMHGVLDRVWKQVKRVLVDGGIACINIGDATRTLGGQFALYPNHARILTAFQKLGFTPLPTILWRKQTNAPNKFMGSGMMPPGAYVTLEHEYVLILRKGNKREFLTEEAKRNRRESAFFWEERNHWFSDVWLDLKGARQGILDKKTRSRSGAFPFELPYRLVSMFSVKGDTVLDPFLGLGTTMLAAMAAARNSVGYELDPDLGPLIQKEVKGAKALANARVADRLRDHAEFAKSRHETKGAFGYPNEHYGFPVVTRQETSLLLHDLRSVRKGAESTYEVAYTARPQSEHIADWSWFFSDGEAKPPQRKKKQAVTAKEPKADAPTQLDMLSLLE